MQAVEELPLAQLAARYSDSDNEAEVQKGKQHTCSSSAQQEAVGTQALAATTQPAGATAEPVTGSSEEDWDEEEEWDSEEDDELASALEWAELREVQEARGNAGGSGSMPSLAAHRPNAHGGVLHRAQAKLLPTPGNMGRLESRFNAGSVQVRGDELLDTLGNYAAGMDTSVANQVKATHGGKAAGGGRSKDRSDRATVEQVLDPRTRMVLFKMLNRGVFSEINGCVSTGKEANVYHASAGPQSEAPGSELAIKVYKTAILVFRDRDRYVVGDSRFARYCKSNPRKMVKMWAEKEMRNLARIHAAGIPSPKPLQLRMHVLVMEFLGENGVAAPRLKDAGLPPARMRQAYTEMVVMMRQLYQKCRLVHADLSEYNILVHRNELHCIDVSQAVELDHPRAFDFLREDCQHVNDYFRRAGVATLTVRELFDFTVDPTIGDGPELDAEMDRLMELAASRPPLTAEETVADAVFARTHIPKKLEEVANPERDHARLAAGTDIEGIYYPVLSGMKADMSAPKGAPQPSARTDQQQQAQAQQQQSKQQSSEPQHQRGVGDLQGRDELARANGTAVAAAPVPPAQASDSHPASEGIDADERGREDASAGPEAPEGSPKQQKRVTWADEVSGSEGSGSDSEEWEQRPKLTRDQIREQRREHKREVKAANQERRKDKMPKHVKKRAEKKGKKK